jgi:hypothetical protein
VISGSSLPTWKKILKERSSLRMSFARCSEVGSVARALPDVRAA